ncbi:MAG: ABC transporter permease [Pirellulaceae bacterium]|nr:MAG: ABC transporter permease [Pirellulaceae bacterium]
MTAVLQEMPAARSESDAEADRAGWLDRLSDYFNPILVKEARQAVKSRTFVWPFCLTLIAALGWSYFSAGHIISQMQSMDPLVVFIGFYVILAATTLILVPYSAYQAVGSERQEATLELVWITSLTGRQIVIGKFLGCLLQLLAYVSALAPCLAFTYMLQGIDIVAISLVLVYLCVASLVLTSFAILLATAFRNTYASMTVSAVLLVGLVILFFAITSFVADLIWDYGFRGGENIQWIHWLVLTTAGSFIVLFLLAAGAQLSFAGDNQSTPLRIVMLAQQALFVFWIVYGVRRAGDDGFVWGTFPVLGLYWGLMGAFMVGELALLSPRARRTLPRSALGRILFTWLQPGSGTGYVFSLVNLAGVMLFLSFVCHAQDRPRLHESLVVAIATWVCVAAYLGTGRLLVLLINRIYPTGAIIGFAIVAILAATGVIVPAIATELADYYPGESPWMSVNWAWVMSEILQNTRTVGQTLMSDLRLVYPLANIALLTLPLNLAFTVTELAAGRLPQPVVVPWEVRRALVQKKRPEAASG